MFVDIVSINIKEIKFEDITVTFQFRRPSMPIMIKTAKKQLSSGKITHRISRNIMARAATMKMNTPKPNTIRSFLMNEIMSSATIETPPKCTTAYFS